ncbi:MAG TPA: hypothetical protein VGJ09_16510 [Bryobacteraceae bacterium]
MNWKTFFAMLGRDAHVARRNAMQLVMQTFLQPLLFVFIFGKVMVGSGYMPEAYKSLLLPGIIAISMTFTGVWAVAMPLIAEFQWTREIEDRLLAPISVGWIAVEKIIAGMLQALVAGLVVIPLAWLVLRPGVQISIGTPLTFAVVYSVGCRIFRLWWAGTRLQHQPAAYRPDVQHGDDADDLFRLYLLSLECAEHVPHSAKDRPRQSPGICQRRDAGYARSAVSTSVAHGRDSGAAVL